MNDKLKESLINNYDEKLTKGVLIHIPEISYYNHNFYIGKKREGKASQDLIYVESDDDNFSVYYLITQYGYISFGYSFTSEGDLIHFDEEAY